MPPTYLGQSFKSSMLISIIDDISEDLGNVEKSGSLRFKCNFAARSLATPRCEKQSALFGVISKVIRSLLVEK